MLATILKSRIASEVTVYIIRTFANMRKLISQNISMFERFERIEQRLNIHDENFDKLFEALEDKSLKPKQLKLDFEKYKKQYQNIELFEFKNSHDRFLIIDKKKVYHIGASLKDLGKKWFAFSKFEIENLKILDKLNSQNYKIS